MEGSHWWKSHLKLIHLLKNPAICKVGQGNTTILCQNNWQEQSLVEKFSELHSQAINDKATVASMINSENLVDHFHGP